MPRAIYYVDKNYEYSIKGYYFTGFICRYILALCIPETLTPLTTQHPVHHNGNPFSCMGWVVTLEDGHNNCGAELM